MSKLWILPALTPKARYKSKLFTVMKLLSPSLLPLSCEDEEFEAVRLCDEAPLDGGFGDTPSSSSMNWSMDMVEAELARKEASDGLKGMNMEKCGLLTRTARLNGGRAGISRVSADALGLSDSASLFFDLLRGNGIWNLESLRLDTSFDAFRNSEENIFNKKMRIFELTLFTRKYCGICEHIFDIIKATQKKMPDRILLSVKDVDMPENKHWLKKYSFDVPVVHLGDKELFRHRQVDSVEDLVKLLHEKK